METVIKPRTPPASPGGGTKVRRAVSDLAIQGMTCGNCAQHLGWKYDALQKKARPRGFFGVLKQAVEEVPEEPEPTEET